jgi:hypothetical protein
MILEDEHYVLTEAEENDYKRLAMYLGAVLQNPSAFTPTGDRATKVKTLLRGMKVAQPTTRANKRKARQDKRIATQKARRADRQYAVAEHNRVRELMEAEAQEAAEARAELEAKLSLEPRVDVLTVDGNVLVAGVPVSMLRPVEPEQSGEVLTDYADPNRSPLAKVILPGSAEKAMERGMRGSLYNASIE